MPRLKYEIIFKQDLPKEFKDYYLKNGKLPRLEVRSPATYTGILIRARRDLDILHKIAEKFGYFDAKIDFEIKDEPIRVIWDINLGQRYLITDLIFKIDNSLARNLKEKFEMRVKPNIDKNFNTDNIVGLNKYVAEVCFENGFPFAQFDQPELIIDNKARSLVVVFIIKTGPLSRIKKTVIEPVKGVSSQFIMNRLAWGENELFDSRKVDKSRKRLLRSGVVGDINFKPEIVDGQDRSRKVNIKMDVSASHTTTRSIGAGVKYATYDGFEGDIFWSNVNLRGKGDRMKVSLIASRKKRKALFNYVVTDFLNSKQELENQIYFLKNRLRAYKVKMWHASTIIDREITDRLKVGLGVAYEKAIVTQDNYEQRGQYCIFPLSINLDASDDKMNPTKGFRVGGKLKPYYGNLGNSKRMVKVEGEGSAYLPLLVDEYNLDNLVLAGRIKSSVIHINNAKDILPIKRVYAGGMNSVRAYGNQMVSPIGSYGEPLGGKYLLEWSAEARFRFNQKWGAVAFVDAGTVLMDLNKKYHSRRILWGPGLGLRFFTGMGPLRLDIAVPMKRRRAKFRSKKIDSPFQLYISFGQAF